MWFTHTSPTHRLLTVSVFAWRAKECYCAIGDRQTARDLRTPGNPASPVSKTSHPFGKHFVEKLCPQAGLPVCFAVQTMSVHHYVGVCIVQERRRSLARAKFGRDWRHFNGHRTTSAQDPSPDFGTSDKTKGNGV